MSQLLSAARCRTVPGLDRHDRDGIPPMDPDSPAQSDSRLFAALLHLRRIGISIILQPCALRVAR